jgi:CRP-like cAMP-binding protein
MSVVKMLKAHELFRSLAFEDVERISSFTGLMDFDEGEKVFSTDAYGSHFYVVLEGSVNLRLPSKAHEASLVVGRVGKGDMFGLSPLIGSGRHTTTAQCSAPSKVLAIEAKPLRTMLEEKSLIGLDIMSVIAQAYFTRYIETLVRFQRVINEIASI